MPRPAQPRLLTALRARPRLLLSAVVGLVCAVLAQWLSPGHGPTRALIGWNIGAWLYLVLAAQMMLRSSHEQMRSRATTQDEGQWVMLALVVACAAACLLAIVSVLGASRELPGPARQAHVALAVLTVLSSWLFTHTMFALHYAHDFYVERQHGRPGGLRFPGEEHPDYLDFLYFAFIIGTSAQTADVSVESRRMRRTNLLHCMLSFAFNTLLLAMAVNIAANLLQ